VGGAVGVFGLFNDVSLSATDRASDFRPPYLNERGVLTPPSRRSTSAIRRAAHRISAIESNACAESTSSSISALMISDMRGLLMHAAVDHRTDDCERENHQRSEDEEARESAGRA